MRRKRESADAERITHSAEILNRRMSRAISSPILAEEGLPTRSPSDSMTVALFEFKDLHGRGT